MHTKKIKIKFADENAVFKHQLNGSIIKMLFTDVIKTAFFCVTGKCGLLLRENALRGSTQTDGIYILDGII